MGLGIAVFQYPFGMVRIEPYVDRSEGFLMRRLGTTPPRSESQDASVSLGSFHPCFFGLPSSSEALLLTPIVRAGFQFVVLTCVAVEKDDFLRMLRLRHGVSPLGILGSIEPAFWPQDAEASASSDASASCYGRPENVRIFAVIVAKLKLVQVERQILLADVVVRPDDAPLEQRPEAFDIVGVDVPANVLILGVPHGVVFEAHRGQIDIAAMFIGRDERYAVANGLADEAIKCRGLSIFDNLADHIPLSADGSDYRGLPAHPGNVLFLTPVAVLVLAADCRFVHFHDPHQTFEIIIAHTSPKPMADVPRGMQGRTLAKEHATNLTGRHALFALQHGVKNLEPRYERDIRVLKDRSYENREPIGRAFGWSTLHALPMEGSRRSALVNLCVVAARTMRTIGPTTHREIGPAGRFVGEGRHQLLEGHHAHKISARRYVSQEP